MQTRCDRSCRTKPTCWSESPGFPTQHEPNQREFATIFTNWAMSETFRQIRLQATGDA